MQISKQKYKEKTSKVTGFVYIFSCTGMQNGSINFSYLLTFTLCDETKAKFYCLKVRINTEKSFHYNKYSIFSLATN